MRKLLAAALILGVPALGPRTATGAEEGTVKSASGTVVAATEASKTLVVRSTLGGKPWIIGAEVTDRTRFAGRAKSLADIKTGDVVRIEWVREENRLVVRSVKVR